MALTPGSLVTPAHMVPPGFEQQQRAALGPRLVAAVQRVGGNMQGTILYRDLLATDLQSTLTRCQNANSTSLGASTFTTIFSGSTGLALPVNQSFGFYGMIFYDASPLIDIVKFLLGASGTPLTLINVSQTYGDNRITRCFFEPVIYKPQETIDIQFKANATVSQSSANFNFMGLVAEPVGLNITPRSDLSDLNPVS